MYSNCFVLLLLLLHDTHTLISFCFWIELMNCIFRSALLQKLIWIWNFLTTCWFSFKISCNCDKSSTFFFAIQKIKSRINKKQIHSSTSKIVCLLLNKGMLLCEISGKEIVFWTAEVKLNKRENINNANCNTAVIYFYFLMRHS